MELTTKEICVLLDSLDTSLDFVNEWEIELQLCELYNRLEAELDMRGAECS